MLGDAGPWPVIMGLYIVTAMATMIIPTAALVVLMSPIVLSAMSDMGYAPETAMMAVAMAPRKLIAGVPLTIVVFIAVMILLPFFWPLQPV